MNLYEMTRVPQVSKEKLLSHVADNPWYEAMQMSRRGAYRGLSTNGAELIASSEYSSVIDLNLYKKRIRKDRNPLDSDMWQHLLTNEWFKEKFNYEARKAGLFVSSRRSAAAHYAERNGATGILGLVFPVGGEVIWSPEYSDLLFKVDGLETREDVLDVLEEGEYEISDPLVYLTADPGEGMVVGSDEYYILAFVPKQASREYARDAISLADKLLKTL